MTDPSKTLYYNITIQCALDGFCFVIHHQEENKIIDIGIYQTSGTEDETEGLDALENALQQKGILGKPFLSVTYIVTDPCHTLVPFEIFDEREREAYLRFNYVLPKGQKLFHEPLKNQKAVNVFATSEKRLQRLQSFWPNLTITHQSTVFLDSILQEEPYESNVNAYLNVNSRSFDLAIINNGQITFFNNFKFNTKDDFIYYLMFTLEQQQLANQDVPVHFSGLISNNSEIIHLCERYIRRIRFLRPDGSVNVDLSLNSTPFQYYYIPYKQLSCES